MSPFRSSIRNAGAAPFYAPYREEGEDKSSSALPRAKQRSGYLHFSNLTRGFSGSEDTSPQPSVRGVLAVLGGILVHICLGTVYTWGTLAVYVISYMRLLQGEKSTPLSTAEEAAVQDTATGQAISGETAFGHLSQYTSTGVGPVGVATVRLSDAAWIVACQFAGMALAMPLGGKIERKVGPSKTVLAGGTIMCAAVAAAPYVLHNYLLFLACYGLMQGAGLGVAYTAPLVCGLSWFPHRKGVVSGAITAGFGTGALLFSPLQAAYLNPLNIPPTFAPYPEQPAELYYDPNAAEERAVMLRIPPLLRRLAVAYMLLLGTGAALLQPRPPTRSYSRGAGVSAIACGAQHTKGEQKDLYIHPAQHAVGEAASGVAAAGVGESEAGVAMAAVKDGTGELEDVEGRKEKLQVRAALCSRPFWGLWGLFFMNGLAICFTASFWRFLAVDRVSRTYILSEAQLAVVGAAASASNAAGRIAWGQVVDLKGFRAALMLLTALWSGLLLYLPNAASHGGLAFAATVCGSFFCLGGNFAVFPSAVAALFGRDAIALLLGSAVVDIVKDPGHLYGYVFTSQLGSSLCFAFLTQRLVQALGTEGLCTLMGLCCLASAGAAAFLPSFYSPRTRQKERRGFFGTT